ncbi:MAG: hypothetical protein M0P14_08160 [Alkaliphilus sp.]|nr:hypothetical protein [Alkaliphilus sp.]
MEKCRKPCEETVTIDRSCCISDTGCSFNGCLDGVVGECIFVDKVYDGVTFNLQGLQIGNRISFGRLPTRCGSGAKITKVRGIKAKKFFNPDNINDSRNLIVTPITTLSGAQFVTDCKGSPVTVPGPAGLLQYLIYADTSECDGKSRGTPVFGSQEVHITGSISVEMDIDYTTDNDCKTHRATLRARMPVNQTLTNFFELCMPSVFDSTFLPQFTEFCNIAFFPRLRPQQIANNIKINPTTGEVTADLAVALCITCEKKIKVPVQLCVLSTGFCEQQVSAREVCPAFPSLFPPQVNIPHVPCIRSLDEDFE